MATNTTTAPANKKVTVATVPAPKGAATGKPAAAGKPAATFTGFKHPVNATQLQQYINTQCGGNAANVGIAALPNIAAGQQVPFLRKGTGARTAIVNALLWGFAPGHTGPVNLAAAMAWCKTKGYATQGYADLLALLNGGFSASSKTWGTPFASLVAMQAGQQPSKPAPSKPAKAKASKPAKAKASKPAPAQPPAPSAPAQPANTTPAQPAPAAPAQPANGN